MSYLCRTNKYLIYVFRLFEVSALEKKFEMLPVCPLNGEQIGDEWGPFAGYMDPSMAWRAYLDYQQIRQITFLVKEFDIKNIKRIFAEEHLKRVFCTYQGIVAGDIIWRFFTELNNNFIAIILLENDCRPRMGVSRLEVLDLPLKVLTVIYGIIGKYHLLNHAQMHGISDRKMNTSLKEWREVRHTQS